jgi:hypothetical protein
MYQNFIIPYLYGAQNVPGDTPPIIRSQKLHWQPLVFNMWKAVRRGAHTFIDNVYQQHVQQPSTYIKSEAASAVLGS